MGLKPMSDADKPQQISENELNAERDAYYQAYGKA